MTTSDPSEDELAEFRELDDDSWDRRTDEVAERHPQLRMQLPEDLSELHGQVGKAASLRKAWSPDEPWYVFEDFETYRCFIGGMGMVIEALDLELDRKVAIKFCKQSGPEAQTANTQRPRGLPRCRIPTWSRSTTRLAGANERTS